MPPLQEFIKRIVGPDVPIRITAYDGTDIGPSDAKATIVFRSPDALRRIVTAPGELGFARAFVAGDIAIEGDIYEALLLQDRFSAMKLGPKQIAEAACMVGPAGLRPLPPPPEEARIKGRRHSRERDAQAIAHHYNVSNRFYQLFLGSTMTYSCAVFEQRDDSLERAQTNKYELISRKLDLKPGMRLLDVGCGWGGMVMHAAKHHGVTAVGVTVSQRQVDMARARVAAAGLADQVEIRFQDYRDVADGPYDAISSIGMFEHVGLTQLGEYFERVRSLLVPNGRLLNHAISRPPFERERIMRAGFMNRYVFPDGELHEIGKVTSALQEAGFEARHMESMREHYARTLRLWVANLEANWDEAVAETSLARARIWRLYMAAAAVNFELNRTQIHQILAVNNQPNEGDAGVALRPTWTGSLADVAPVLATR